MSPIRRRPLRRRRAARVPRTRLADFGFPGVPRLELDQLLVQLADRADDVLAAQGRLRRLLRANALVAGDLSLPVVLRQILGAAQGLPRCPVRGARRGWP
jgi:hypothetical protein